MGLTNFFKSLSNEVTKAAFEAHMESLIKKADSKTVVFTQVRRIDGESLSSYAIEAALEDGSPVYLQTAQGKVMLAKGEFDNHIENTVPPEKGDYIFICDYNIQREDIYTEYYNLKRESNTQSDDIFAFYFLEEKGVLCCSANEEAVRYFKDVYEKKNIMPMLAKTTLEINAKLFSRICAWSHFGLSSYKLYIKGEKFGVISGEKEYFAIEPGEYNICVKNMFGLERSNTIKITVKEGECLKLHTDYNMLARSIWCFPYILGVIPKLKTIKIEQA